MKIEIRRIRTGEGERFRTIRLAALLDAPHAFCSTHAGALERTPESWHEQADRSASGSERATFLALAHGEAVGIAAVYAIEQQPKVAEALQVWTAPSQRGSGLGRRLMHEVLMWATEAGFERVNAGVRDSNPEALGFYQHLGFITETTEKGVSYLSIELADVKKL